MNNRPPPDLSAIRPDRELDGPLTHPPSRRRRPQRRRAHRERRVSHQGVAFLPWWGKLLAAFAGIIVLVSALVVGFIALVSPAELVRDELIRQVKAKTGRDLLIKGGAHVVFYPSIGISFADVSLSRPAGMVAGGPALTAQRIELSVALPPLLDRKVEIERISLVRPMIDLHIDKNGRTSWQLALGAQSRPLRVAQLGGGLTALQNPETRKGMTHQASAPLAAAPSELLEALELRSVNLTKATIVYRDDRTGVAERVDDVDAHLTGRRISDPMQVRGTLVWQNEQLRFDARLDTLSQLLAGRAAKARITVSGPPLSAGFDGTVKQADGVELAGQTRLSGDSLFATARWLRVLLPNAGPLGGYSVTGRLVADQKSAALNGANLKLGDTRAVGTVRVAFAEARPAVNADLKISELDIDMISAAFSEAGRAVPEQPAPVRDQARQPQEPPTSIEDLLRRSTLPEPAEGPGRLAPEVRGYTNRNEWSSDPLDAELLRQLDASARIRIDGLKVAGLVIGRAVSRLSLADGSARLDIDDLDLYDGSGKGVVTAKPQGGSIVIGANLNVARIEAKALLRDAAGFEHLDGRGDLSASFSGSGASQKAIAQSISGRAKFIFKDGAVIGWNLAKILRGLQSGRISNFDALPSEKTDFSELSASFSMASGVARTTDLALLSPLLRVAGEGNIGIGERNIDLALRPKLVSTVQGQGATAGAVGIEVPVKLRGPWHDPAIVPDIGGIAKDPAQLIGRAKDLGRQFKGRSLGDVVRGVLGESDKKNVGPLEKLLSR